MTADMVERKLNCIGWPLRDGNGRPTGPQPASGLGFSFGGRGARSRAHAAGTFFRPVASARRVFLLPLPGAATCSLSLSGPCFRDASGTTGRENRAAHRRSQLLCKSRGTLTTNSGFMFKPHQQLSGVVPGRAAGRTVFRLRTAVYFPGCWNLTTPCGMA
jgi:hypothetical protein